MGAATATEQRLPRQTKQKIVAATNPLGDDGLVIIRILLFLLELNTMNRLSQPFMARVRPVPFFNFGELSGRESTPFQVFKYQERR